MHKPVRPRAAHALDDRAIRPSDERLLAALLAYHFLTPAQLTRLHFAAGAATHVYAKLHRLAAAGHVQALPMLRPQVRGSSRLVYALARSGLAHLRDMGIDPPAAFRLHEPKRFSYLFYDHQVALADVLVAATCLARLAPHLRLEGFVHDRELQRSPVMVTLAAGERVALAPDAFLSFGVALPGRRGRYPVLLEVDRGTVDKRSWERRIAAYALGEAAGTLPAAFGVATLTVAIVVPDPKRLRELVRLVATVLERIGLAANGDLFVLTDADPVARSPDLFFRSPVWAVPGTGDRVSLVEVPEVVVLGGNGGA